MATVHEEKCKVCRFGPEKIDWNLSNAEISRLVDCSKDSVSRHKKYVEKQESQDEIQWEAVKKWDAADGTVKYSYRRSDTGTEHHLDNKRIDSLIRDWPSRKPGTKFTGKTEVATPADLQLGKSEKGIGTDDTIRKFYASIEQVAQRWEILKPEQGILADMGDVIENIYSVKSQATTNDRTLPEQIEDAVTIYMNAIGRLRVLVEDLVMVMETSNHTEARNEMKNNPYDSENDWGLHILRVIQGKCEDRGWDNVTFIRPDKWEDTAVVTTKDGTTIAFTHGHHSGTPTAMEKWVSGQILGKCPGHDAHIWVHGHYHNPTHFSLGNGIDVFGTPSLDPGSAWYAKKSGKKARQGIVAFTVDKGMWYNYSIL